MATTPHVVPRRRGVSSFRLIGAVFLVSAVGAMGWWLWHGRRTVADALPMLHKVERGDFAHDLTEQGTIESGNNAEIRCEVKSNNMAGTTILDIVPEGKLVEKGEELAHLDSSALESDRLKQESVVNTAEADLIKARTAVETAELALKEYKDGTFPQLLATAKGEQAVAEENLGRAKEYARYSERLQQKGYITRMQLEADQFAVEKAKNDLEVAKSKLDVLKNYTYATQIQTLSSDIETAKAKLKSQENIHKLESDKLAFITDQIQKCTLRAPVAGQVVYANSTNQWGDKTAVIEAGATTRERQPVIRLPDRTQMIVKVKINESKIAMVMTSQSASIRLDALPEKELEGTVVKVDEYPIPTNRFSSSVKEYEATVRIHNPPEGLRPGLTAQVTIHVERVPQVVQVPVQAVIEHGERHYCVLCKEDGLQAREVKLGSTNDKFVVVREGLIEGEEVVRNAAACREKLALPETPAERPTGTMVAQASAPPAKSARKETPVPREKGRAKQPGYVTAVVTPSPGNPAAAERAFREYDKGGQGRVTLADLPEKVRPLLKDADANRDGAVNRAELNAVLAQRPNAREDRMDAEAHPRPVARPGGDRVHGARG